MRRAAVFSALAVVLASTVPAYAFVSRRAPVTRGTPYAASTADELERQGSILFPASEVEPHLAVNPADSDHIVATWQQDRFDNGAARGTRIAVSFDRGDTWTRRGLPSATLCTGGTWQRASDPWIDIAADGTVYQMSLVITRDAPPPYRSGMTVSRSRDGGLTWSTPQVLVDDTDTGTPHDKNSLTVVTYFDFRSDGPAETARTDHWGVMCRPRTRDDCTRARRWNREVRLTDTTFDITDAPFAGGYFIGDYMGLDTIGTQGFVTAYSRPFKDDPASVFVRRFNRRDAAPVAP
jgi:hypothetical protein